MPYVDLRSQFEEERQSLLEVSERVLSGGDYILGEEVEAFEEELARYCGTRVAIGVANGTDALVLALRALEIGPGDEVITAPNSWLSTAAAIVQCGAKPVFAEVDEHQLLNPSSVEGLLSPRTRCLLPVHLGGRCADLRALSELARPRGIPILEDAAQAIGAERDGIRAGTGGIAACFSMHPLKNLNACGDAGAIVTNDEGMADRLRKLRNHGLRGRGEAEFWGSNSRLDSLQAAFLRVRLRTLESRIDRRRAIATLYSAKIGDLVTVPSELKSERHTYHLYVIQTDRRDELKSHLQARGVDTRIHYPVPLHLQPAAAELGYVPGSFPRCEEQARRILSLPVHPYLSAAQVAQVIGAVREFLS